MSEAIFDHFRVQDEEISAWFADKSWPVTARHYDFDRSILGWRHEGEDGTSRTLRITMAALEDYPPHVLLLLMDQPQEIAAMADKYVVIREQANGNLVVDILPEAA